MPDDVEDREAPSATRRRRRAGSAPPENGISASRRARKKQGRAQPPTATETSAAAAASAAAKESASNTNRADTDPWTVPQSVRDRFVQEGNRFYYPDGAPAFRDRGRRLTTVSENTEIVRSLVEIARSRGWTEVSVSGTERFRAQAWQQARLAGLSVRGYRPSEEERIQVVRAIGRSHDEVAASVSTDVPPAAPARGAEESPERIRGKLLEHGKDFYRHDPNEPPSYFVRLKTATGTREIWGKDIERAVAKSLSQPKVGDEVVLQRTGREVVTVKRREKDEKGELREREVGAFRNRWVLETQEFFEKRAQVGRVLRDTSLSPQEATQRHPELAGTYVGLRAAELASSRLRDPEDRRRFLAQVRRALAEDIERGEPLLAMRLRERAASRATRERPPLTRE
jgi:conjugative element/phage-associated large polyvalent protein